MAVKLADTLAPMGDFEIAEAKDISVNIGGTKKMLQKAIEDGDIGGASDIVVKCTEDQYGALLPDQKALNIIYCTEKKLYYHDETIAPVVDTTPITDSIGDLDSLSTTDKTSLVAAINETNANLGELEKKVGTNLHWYNGNISSSTTWRETANILKDIFREVPDFTTLGREFIFKHPFIMETNSGSNHEIVGFIIQLDTGDTNSGFIYSCMDGVDYEWQDDDVAISNYFKNCPGIISRIAYCPDGIRKYI